MPEMISKVAHVYDGRKLAAGDRFHADKAFVAALIGLGRAEPAPIESGTQEYPTRELAAVDPAPYQRRDLGAGERKKRRRPA